MPFMGTNKFGGLNPRLDESMVPATAARKAENVDVTGGNVKSINVASPFYALHDGNSLDDMIPSGEIAYVPKPANKPVIYREQIISEPCMEIDAWIFTEYYENGWNSDSDVIVSNYEPHVDYTDYGFRYWVTVGSATFNQKPGIRYRVSDVKFQVRFDENKPGPTMSGTIPSDVSAQSARFPRCMVPYQDQNGIIIGYFDIFRVDHDSAPTEWYSWQIEDSSGASRRIPTEQLYTTAQFYVDMHYTYPRRTRVYVASYVDSDAREGPPSDISDMENIGPGETARIEIPSIDNTYDLRLYRSSQSKGFLALNGGDTISYAHTSESIAGVDTSDDEIWVNGFLTSKFPAGIKVKIANSTGNDGEYTVEYTSTNITDASRSNDYTYIYMEENIGDGTADGDVTPIGYQDDEYGALGETIPMYGQEPINSDGTNNFISPTLLHPGQFGVAAKNESTNSLPGEVWFSDVYRLHAWPEEWKVKFETEIKAIHLVGTTVFVFTKGPSGDDGVVYQLSGNNPKHMSRAQVITTEPLLNELSLCKIGQALYYVSIDGVIGVSSQGPQIITAPYYTRRQWQDLTPSNYEAKVADNAIFLTHSGTGDNLRIDLDEKTMGAVTTWTSTSGVSGTWKSRVYSYPKPVRFSVTRIYATTYSTAISLTITDEDTGTTYSCSIDSSGSVRTPRMTKSRLWSFTITVPDGTEVKHVAIASSTAELNRVYEE